MYCCVLGSSRWTILTSYLTVYARIDHKLKNCIVYGILHASCAPVCSHYIAIELGQHGIRCNSVLFGMTDTDQVVGTAPPEPSPQTMGNPPATEDIGVRPCARGGVAMSVAMSVMMCAKLLPVNLTLQ